MLARRLVLRAPVRMPRPMLLLAIATELGAAGYVFYDGLMSLLANLL